MLKFIRPNFTGGFSVVSELVPVPESMLHRMGLFWRLRYWLKLKWSGLPPAMFYERRIKFTPAELGKEFAFYNEAEILANYPGWFEQVEEKKDA